MLYIAGPMTGIEEYNRPAFAAAEEALAARGIPCINPAKNFGGRVDLEYEEYMRMSMAQIIGVATGITMLPGWDQSRGAILEVQVAKAIGLEIIPLQELLGTAPATPPVFPADYTQEEYRCRAISGNGTSIHFEAASMDEVWAIYDQIRADHPEIEDLVVSIPTPKKKEGGQ